MRDRVVRRERDFRLPTFYGDAAVFRVDAGDNVVGADSRGELGGEGRVDCPLDREERRADNDPPRTGVENSACAMIVRMSPPACTGSRLAISLQARSCQLRIAIKVDEFHKGEAREALDPILESSTRRSFSPCTSWTMRRTPSDQWKEIGMAASPERLRARVLL